MIKSKILLITGIIFVCLAAINCGPKKKVTKFEKPKSVLFAKSSFAIPVFKQIESDKPDGDIKEADSIQVNAQIDVTRKDKSIVTYFEIKCPAKLKDVCGEKEAYIKGSDILGTSLSEINSGQISYSDKLGKAVIVDSDLVNDAATTRDWITSPSKKDKVNIIPDALFLAIAVQVKNADDRSQILSELIIVSELVKDPTYTDSRYDAVFKKYAVLNKRKAGEEARLTGFSDQLLETIKSYNDAGEKKIVSGFPMRSQSYKGLVDQFNRLKKIPFIQEQILQEALKGAKFTVDGGVAELKIENLGREGVKVILSLQDTTGNPLPTEENFIVSINALEDMGSIGFTLKLKDKDISLSPVETPPYFLAGGSGLKEFLSQVPKDYREIMKNNEYEKGVMLTALKFGQGGFDETTGIMKYEFNSAKQYWTMLEMFRLHPRLTRKSDYSGEFSIHLSSEQCDADSVWRQPKGELYVGYYSNKSCGGNNQLVENICMKEGGSETFDVRFSPAEIRSEKPNIQMSLVTTGGDCEIFMNELFGAHKEY
jgi:hypothetical protein